MKGVLSDIAGQKLGMLTVLDQHESRIENGRSAVFYLCSCECGTVKWVRKKQTYQHQASNEKLRLFS